MNTTLTPRMLEIIARCNSMACWWPSITNPIAEPMWAAIAIDLEELAARPGEDQFIAQIAAAAEYARDQAFAKLISAMGQQ